MGLTLAEKIIHSHLSGPKTTVGDEITIKLDQCLLQDATGTMAWLEFEAIGVKKVKPGLCMQYIDHNLLQIDSKNMDDHLFLMTMSSKYGANVSLPGNGISHHVHKERFTRPGETLIGSDSHTSTSGGSGMLAIGVGGMDVAAGMATGKFTLAMPHIVGIKLTGKLKPWSTAKDVILELLRRVDVDGGKGKIWEFYGPGVKTLSVAERSTIANMGAETGATTTVFPSDEMTREFFKAEGRIKDFKPLKADEKCEYSDVLEIDLSEIEPLIACPHSPGKIKTVRDVQGTPVFQSMIGSSTNSSYEEVMNCAYMLEKKQRSPNTFYHVIPGSRQLVETVARDGGLMSLLKAGARISEPSCNACIGMGNAPASGIVSVRSFPRNWEGRSGTDEDQVYLASPETATACAITGEITDPRDLGLKFPATKEPASFVIDDKMIIHPKHAIGIVRGPNIKELPQMNPLEKDLKGKVTIKVGDDVSTDHILPAGAEILALRSNVPAISEFVFHRVDTEFVKRCKEMKGGFIVGGENYGQGSSREHAAIAPRYLGIRGVRALSFARIHRSNLVNFGIIPLELKSKKEYDKIREGDELEIVNLLETIRGGGISDVLVFNKTNGKTIDCRINLEGREKHVLRHGSFLNYVKDHAKGHKK